MLPDPSSSVKDYELPGFKIRLQAAILLLALTVADLCEGILPLGGGTGGGLGFIEVSRVSFIGLPDATSPVEVPDHSEDSHKVHEARTDFARNILTSVISAFGEKCPEAASAEHTAINLIRKWVGSESDGDHESSAALRVRPTQVRISWNSPTGVFVHDPEQKTPANKEHTKSENRKIVMSSSLSASRAQPITVRLVQIAVAPRHLNSRRTALEVLAYRSNGAICREWTA